VLVAENNEEVRGLIKHVLEKAGYRVIEASDGEEAVHKFRENRDSFLLDVTMPRKNGREAYEEIKGINPLIRAVLMGGYARLLLIVMHAPDMYISLQAATVKFAFSTIVCHDILIIDNKIGHDTIYSDYFKKMRRCSG